MKQKITSSLELSALVSIIGVTAFPVYYLITLSFKESVDMFVTPPRLLFFQPTLENFVRAFSVRPVDSFLFNSVIIAAISTLLSVTVAALGGYGFSRYSFRGKNLVMFSVVATRMIPPITLVFPMFLIMRNLSLLNTRTGLILAYTTFNIPFAVLILKNFFDRIPKELDESAAIDGCGRLRCFLQIILPNARSGIAAAAILSILLSWKDYLWAVRFTFSHRSQTLPVLVGTFVGDTFADWPVMVSIAVLGIVPIFLFALLSQNNLVKGLTAGALKG
jgi:multiple sugar transport system permease protein